MTFRKADSYLIYWLLAVCMAAAAAPPARAQQSANNARGLNAESYQSGPIDDVNLYNGNLTLSISLGKTYTTGGNLAFGLTLHYNSNAWEIFPENDDHAIRPDNTTGPAVVDKAIPDPQSNAGMGWRLSLGALYAPRTPVFNPAPFDSDWLYVAPDGSEHRFHPTLYVGEAPDGKLYTQDGSFLRLRVRDAGGNPIPPVLEFPDGQVHTFDGQGRLTRIRDPWGNRIDVAYTDSLNKVWTITEFNRVHGALRTHYVHFNQFGQVSSVRLASFGGGHDAEYVFTYDTAAVQRHRKNVYNFPANGQSAEAVVQLLKVVRLPAGAGSYTFDYPLAYNNANASEATEIPGVLKRAVLPTGGKYEWDYMGYGFRTGPHHNDSFPDPQFPFRWSSSEGVREKRIMDGAAVLGRYTYAQEEHPTYEPGTANVEDSYLTTSVVAPDGNLTVHYFRNKPGMWDYGLPYSRHKTDGGSFVSKEFYRGATPDAANLLRTSSVRYEADYERTDIALGDDLTVLNRRVAAERTRYHDDGKFADVVNTDWNRLGKYRTSTTGGNFDGGNVRTVYTNHLTYGERPGTNAAWVLGIYSWQDVTEGGVRATTEFAFDLGTGALLRKRTRKATAQQPQDVVVRNTYNADGAVAREEYFGGDRLGGLPTGGAWLATMTLPAGSKEYEVNHAYTAVPEQNAIRHTAAFAGQSFYTADEDIDRNSGLIRESRDAAGVRTANTYDALGRLTHTQTHTDALTVYTYLVTEMQMHRFNPSNAAVTFNYARVDPFGRVNEEGELLPAVGWSRRQTTYDAMGRRLSVSEFGNFTKKTQYAQYDPFGRPGRVIAADGTAVDFDYLGVSRVRSIRRVGTSQAGGVVSRSPFSVYEFYDRQGRLSGVQEDSGPGDTPRATNYQYDVGGRLKQVAINYGAAGEKQFRNFTYDHRGFLAAEDHPEQNRIAGRTNTVEYKYDSMGRVVEQQDARSRLQLTYDSAGRQTAVNEWVGSWRPLKTFAYYDANVAGFDNAKLRHAVRYNYVFNPFDPAQSPTSGTEIPIQIKESYEYAGRAGRVSKRETFFNAANPTPYHFVQHFSYDLLGNLESQTYPYCVNATCTQSGAQNQRTVRYTHTLGRPTQVGVAGSPGHYANSVGYHLNRAVASVAHGNGVTDTHEMDPNHMARPRRIRTSNGFFDTGNFEYDGAGNIVKIGPDWFLYDGANRVKEATAQYGTRKRETYAYDPQGNLLYLKTFTNLGDAAPWMDMQLSVNAATNRLDGILYDGSGNVLGAGSQTYHYDALNMQKYAPNKIYLYGPADERMWVVDHSNRADVFDVAMLRGLNNELLREYQVRKPPQTPWATSEHGDRVGNWTWQKDYVYLGGDLLAAETAQFGRLDYHVDHLGSPRLVTNASGQAVEPVKHYFPYGREASETVAIETRLNFTGHERDVNYYPGHLLDYMHARHYTPHHGRFLSVDPGRDFDPRRPQSWNLYAYVRNNPVNTTDPTGRESDQQPAASPNPENSTILRLLKEDAPLNHEITEAYAQSLSEGGSWGTYTCFRCHYMNNQEYQAAKAQLPEFSSADWAPSIVGLIKGVVTGGAMEIDGPLKRQLTKELAKKGAPGAAGGPVGFAGGVLLGLVADSVEQLVWTGPRASTHRENNSNFNARRAECQQICRNRETLWRPDPTVPLPLVLPRQR